MEAIDGSPYRLIASIREAPEGEVAPLDLLRKALRKADVTSGGFGTSAQNLSIADAQHCKPGKGDATGNPSYSSCNTSQNFAVRINYLVAVPGT